jgi:hypothetical protein
MGIFSKAVDSRVSQILRNALGMDVEVDFIAGGIFTCDPLQITIKPFNAAINEYGIFFIHEGRLILTLSWQSILCRKPDIWGKGSELRVVLNQVSRTTQPKEFPFCYFHRAEIRFNKVEDHEKFISKFIEVKLKSGFTSASLELHDLWLNYGIGLPVSQEKYLKANEGWGDEDSRLDSYLIWGKTQDSQRLLYYVGRSACQGILPTSLIDLAVETWLETEKEASKYTNQISAPNEEAVKLFADTKKLNLLSSNPDYWGIGKIQIQPNEWVSEIPMFQRLAIFEFINANGGQIKFRLWSDFHEGTEVVVLKIESDPGDHFVVMSTSLGVATIDSETVKRFSKLDSGFIFKK